MDRSLYSKPYEELRGWLKEQRAKDEELTLRKLSDDLGIHYSTIGKIEQGRRKIDVVEYVQYCRAISADPAEGLKIIEKYLIE